MKHRPAGPIETTLEPLRAYKTKRNFALTPEPAADGELGTEGFRFVVQKHWARALHYDFRLELHGTLKSWAVPKGPSIDPSVKRMAVQVEDHPLAYADFEGTVPPGQYGAGKVVVWDAGTWLPLNDPHRGVEEGHLKFELFGQKLHGRWVLVRMKGRTESQAPWLLIKEDDGYARSSAEFSVVDALPAGVRFPGHSPRALGARDDGHRSVSAPELPVDSLPSALPHALTPQLATLVAGSPPDTADWLYEIKFDGYRMLLRNDDSGVKLLTRNGHDWTSKLRPLQSAFEGLKLPPGWYDGEIVMPTEAGIPDFGALQQAFDNKQTDDVLLYLFDVPYFAGHDLRAAPLQARRELLKGVLAGTHSDHVRFSEEFDAPAESVVASACKLGLEGIIAKRRMSPYRSSRSTDWVKLKCSRSQEFVVGGYTAPQGTRTDIGALLLGVYDVHGHLHYAGDVGTGFSKTSLRNLKKALDGRGRNASPFMVGTKIAGKPRWVHPTLVVDIRFSEWTRAGHIRHAVFRGLRTDKRAVTVTREKSLALPSVEAGHAEPTPGERALPRRLNVTNSNRVIDASTGTTKLDLVRFYDLVGDLLMKHLKGRPVSLVRAPEGVSGKQFFQKHLVTGKVSGIRQMDLALPADRQPMIEVASKHGLLSAAQWNVVEFHTVNATKVSIGHPDRMVFDLDPGDGVSWFRMQEAAQLVHAFLEQLGLQSFLKTSGGRGLHIVVPIKRVHDWGTVKGFSRAVVTHMAGTIPERFVTRSGPKNRVGRIFIDYLRNGPGATTVCAWSARARPGMGISVPVAWTELQELRGGDHWSVKTIHDRLQIGDTPWRRYSRAARGLSSAMAALGYAPPAR